MSAIRRQTAERMGSLSCREAGAVRFGDATQCPISRSRCGPLWSFGGGSTGDASLLARHETRCRRTWHCFSRRKTVTDQPLSGRACGQRHTPRIPQVQTAYAHRTRSENCVAVDPPRDAGGEAPAFSPRRLNRRAATHGTSARVLGRDPRRSSLRSVQPHSGSEEFRFKLRRGNTQTPAVPAYRRRRGLFLSVFRNCVGSFQPSDDCAFSSAPSWMPNCPRLG